MSRIPFLPKTEALFSKFIAISPTPRQILESFNALEAELVEARAEIAARNKEYADLAHAAIQDGARFSRKIAERDKQIAQMKCCYNCEHARLEPECRTCFRHNKEGVGVDNWLLLAAERGE